MRNSILVFVVLFQLVSCKGNPEDVPSETKVKTENEEKKPEVKVERYAYLVTDAWQRPVGLFKNAEGPFRITSLNGKMTKIEKLDSQENSLSLWTLEVDIKSEMPKSIRYCENSSPGCSRIDYISKSKDEVCQTSWNKFGDTVSKQCVKSKSATSVEILTMDRLDNPVEKSVATIDSKGIILSMDIWTRYGDFKYRDIFNYNIKNDLLTINTRRLSPESFWLSNQEIRINKKGQKTAFIHYHHDGSVKNSTFYEWKTPWKVYGKAKTEDGFDLNIELSLNDRGHRLKEIRKLGPRTLSEEVSTYDKDGRLLKLEQKNSQGQLIHRLKNSYDQMGRRDFAELYRGNIHELECVENYKALNSPLKVKSSVSTKLPALETARLEYDSLSRVVSIKRYYLESLIDTETISWDSRGLVKSKSLKMRDATELQTVDYEYDSAGNVSLEKISRGNRQLEMIRYKWKDGLLIQKELLDGLGKAPLRENWPDGSVVRFRYDKRGRLLEERWFHADGTAALTTLSEGCSSCRTARSKAINRITYEYDKFGKLLKSKEYGDKEQVIYEVNYSYNKLGQMTQHSQSWPLEQKVKKIITRWSTVGWKSSVSAITEIKSKVTYREERKFNAFHLLSVEKFAGAKLKSRVLREYKNGLLVRRIITNDKGLITDVTIRRNAGGLNIEETAVDDKGKPAEATDMWDNRYTNLLAQWNDRNLPQTLTAVNSIKNITRKTVFSYDDQGRQTGRKVYTNTALELQLEETFPDAFLGSYGISTEQHRVTIKGKNRLRSSYRIFLDKTDISKSYAEMVLPDTTKLKLSTCLCKGCGVTFTSANFHQQ